MSQELKRKLAQIEDDLRSLRQERAEKARNAEEAKEAFGKADGLGIDSDEFKAAKEAVGAVGEIDDRIAETQAAQIEILKMLGQDSPPADRRNGSGDEPRQGWATAELFADEGLREALARTAGSKSRFGSIQVGEVASRETMAADVSGTDNMRRGSYVGVVPQLLRPLRVLDLIPVGTTDGNLVPYTQEGGSFTAAETAEGAIKPEGGVTYTDADAPVRTIAAWQKIRKQALSDYAALRSMVDGRLRYSVLRRLEAQVLAGDGAGDNLLGILNTTGIGAVGTGAVPADQVLTGITTVYLADAMASGIVLHPTDWQTMLVAKASGDGQYFSGGPFSVTPQVLWGVPAVPSPAIPQGTALVGDFQIGAQILFREGVQVLFSDSDQDDFVRNRVTLLGETRAAFPVWRPAAFAKVAL